jgi:hypothetical protein
VPSSAEENFAVWHHRHREGRQLHGAVFAKPSLDRHPRPAVRDRERQQREAVLGVHVRRHRNHPRLFRHEHHRHGTGQPSEHNDAVIPSQATFAYKPLVFDYVMKRNDAKSGGT